ncbi:glycosyltransferase [Nodosilinea sp. E11]|uniref:glycosyltransferase n=1 Tax=Nodosilinea sp. E11 TaxID=3037479 RepID=UPI00293495E7|nr:glycosyltransferase [Nodosilinea sp. E11]WOD39259.1 glycosyltransferase [Nodosilinea sp. E11]
MNVFFLDQSGQPGGAELCLADIVLAFPTGAVGLLQDGPFRTLLEAQATPVTVLATEGLGVRKDSGLLAGVSSLGQLLPLIYRTAQAAAAYDVIYANTPKALIVGALASVLSRRPLVYHLHDIISTEHFSPINCRLLVGLANRFAQLVIANSQASEAAFVAAGGDPQKVSVVYNGFRPDRYRLAPDPTLRQALGLGDRFVVGHFSRLSPWKGQHVLIEALAHCPDDVVAVLVGDALFGEDDYVAQLKQQVQRLNLGDRVHFLGFRADIPALMQSCDLVAHTSTAPEPFGRVIVEAMLCQRVAIAAAAGGATELIDHGKTGWLCPPNDPQKLAELILATYHGPEQAAAMAIAAQAQACSTFNLEHTNQRICTLLAQVV